MNREIRTTRRFDRDFEALPADIQKMTAEKLVLHLRDENHPSLRVKRMRGTSDIWELSVSMNYRVTFQLPEQIMLLRRIGTHDILRSP